MLPSKSSDVFAKDTAHHWRMGKKAATPRPDGVAKMGNPLGQKGLPTLAKRVTHSADMGNPSCKQGRPPRPGMASLAIRGCQRGRLTASSYLIFRQLGICLSSLRIGASYNRNSKKKKMQA